MQQQWRRFHAERLCAQVFHDGTAYVAAVVVSEHVQKLERTFSRLQSAQAAADDLLRRTFKHVCTMELCGGTR